MPGRFRMTGWDGRVAVTEATGPKVTVGGKTYELLGLDENGSKVYQDAEVLREQRGQLKEKDDQTQENREKNLRFIENDAKIKAQSGLPKKLVGLPDEKLKYPVKIDISPQKPGDFEFHAIAPKAADLTEVEIMAGEGTSTPIRDVRRLYEVYNLDAQKWQKKSGTTYGKEYHYVIHWYENDGVIPADEIKLKGMKQNK